MILPRERPEYRPLLKWPGGKAREWREIEPHLPRSVRHFVDPFAGGGAPFGRTPFRGEAWLNDRHERLIDLYRLVQGQDAALYTALDEISQDWEALGEPTDLLDPAFRRAVDEAREGRQPAPEAADKALRGWLSAWPLYRRAAAGQDALAYLVASVLDKAKRLARLEVRHAMRFADEDLSRHLETAVRAGYYTLVRAHERDAVSAEAVADFVFVREYCYGSMFRTNARGEFNIPYGGATYNGKRFGDRAARLSSAESAGALAGVHLSCEDFETFLDRVATPLGHEDFVFVDPPYHSDFSTYGGNAFGLDDHRRLAVTLLRLPTRWMQVIKATPEIRALYESGTMRSAGVRVAHDFGKQYGYNVRGRNDRDARHLVIVNYTRSATT